MDQYRTFDQEMGAAGLVARSVVDRAPAGTYLNLLNWEYRQEGALSSRFGRQAITVNVSGKVNTPIAYQVHTLARLKSLVGAQSGNATSTFRYAFDVQGNAYRRSGDTPGSYGSNIAPSAMSGLPCRTSVFRPDISGFPYLFIADCNPSVLTQFSGVPGLMLKDRGDGSLTTLQRWGILPPTRPAQVSVGNLAQTLIDRFNGMTTDYTYVNFDGPAINNQVNTTFTDDVPAGLQRTFVGDISNIVAGTMLFVNGADNVIVLQSDEDFPAQAVPPLGFTCQFPNAYSSGDTVQDWELSGTVAANTVASVSRTPGSPFDFTMVGGEPALGTDQFTLMLELNSQATIANIRITFFTDSGDYYYLDLGPQALRPENNTWSHIVVPRDSFIPVGAPDWSNITKWEIGFTTVNAAAINIGDFYFSRTAALNSTGGTGYDYRYTFVNQAGTESSPSQAMVNQVIVVGQQVTVSWYGFPNDSQIVYVRIYRRGGTLDDNWRQVAQVPYSSGGGTYYDNTSDLLLAQIGTILNVDANPPITSALRVPVNTTITGAVNRNADTTVGVASIAGIWPNQLLVVNDDVFTETVVVEAITGGGSPTITAFFQYSHVPGTQITAAARIARPVNLCAVAFSTMWMAGDPDNPNILYYSAPNQPESFPVENTVEIGTPDDPIMAIVPYAGQLFIGTANTWYNATIGINGVPQIYPTASVHGVRGINAWTIVEGEIWFLSYDGFYSLSGQTAPYKSEIIEWLPRGITLGPVVPFNTADISTASMLYDRREVFCAYTDTNGNIQRVIFDIIRQRWRNDDRAATAMIYEEDSTLLLYADYSSTPTAMIWQDRINDYDDGGYAGGVAVVIPINLNLQFPFNDENLRKQIKVYNEATLDIDTNSQELTATLVTDSGETNTTLGTVTSTERTQVQIQAINNGFGVRSRNQSLIVSGAVTSVVTLFKYFLRGTVEAELRKSLDTYWTDFGSNQWKFVKQGWFNYTAQSAGGISICVYIDGDESGGEFSFTLPQALSRSNIQVRFPATEFRLIRMIGVSDDDFQMFPDSHLEWKPASTDKGYASLPFEQLITTSATAGESQ